MIRRVIDGNAHVYVLFRNIPTTSQIQLVSMIIGTAYLKGEKNFELFFASLKFRFPSLKKVFPYTLKSISFCFLVLCRPCILKEVCFKIYQISNAKISKQKITLLKKCNWFVLLFIV